MEKAGGVEAPGQEGGGRGGAVVVPLDQAEFRRRRLVCRLRRGVGPRVGVRVVMLPDLRRCAARPPLFLLVPYPACIAKRLQIVHAYIRM